MNIDMVAHLMCSHTPSTHNENGVFVKGECQVTLGLSTNCGVYWSFRTCANAECDCKVIDEQTNQPKTEEEHMNPIGYLLALDQGGYSFKGWIDQDWDGQECQCADKTPVLTIYKLKFN